MSDQQTELDAALNAEIDNADGFTRKAVVTDPHYFEKCERKELEMLAYEMEATIKSLRGQLHRERVMHEVNPPTRSLHELFPLPDLLSPQRPPTGDGELSGMTAAWAALAHLPAHAKLRAVRWMSERVDSDLADTYGAQMEVILSVCAKDPGLMVVMAKDGRMCAIPRSHGFPSWALR